MFDKLIEDIKEGIMNANSAFKNFFSIIVGVMALLLFIEVIMLICKGIEKIRNKEE